MAHLKGYIQFTLKTKQHRGYITTTKLFTKLNYNDFDSKRKISCNNKVHVPNETCPRETLQSGFENRLVSKIDIFLGDLEAPSTRELVTNNLS